MITKNTYYKGEIYIPQAKPSITDEATAVDTSFTDMVEKYEEDCLIKCLGYSLYKELADVIDISKPTLLKDGVDDKWNKLINGHSYTIDGESVESHWRGIRYKTPIGSENYNRSFLAYYVYFFYERSRYITTTAVGHAKEDYKNARIANPTQKVVEAWNSFVEIVQGKNIQGIVHYKNGLIGVDYYNKNSTVTLYQFIKDMNDINEDTYPNFTPHVWGEMNKFNL